MVTIGMNYKVLPGKEETFEKACTGVIEAMNGIDGHEESFLYRDVNDGKSYLIASEWGSEDAFNNFYRAKIDQYFENPEDFEISKPKRLLGCP